MCVCVCVCRCRCVGVGERERERIHDCRCMCMLLHCRSMMLQFLSPLQVSLAKVSSVSTQYGHTYTHPFLSQLSSKMAQKRHYSTLPRSEETYIFLNQPTELHCTLTSFSQMPQQCGSCVNITVSAAAVSRGCVQSGAVPGVSGDGHSCDS